MTLVGDDTDLIVLLLYHTKVRRLFPGELFFRTKKSTWDISLLVDSVQGQPFMQHSILSPQSPPVTQPPDRSTRARHSGEDTEYWEAVDVFEKRSASKVEVVAAGRRIVQTIYSTVDERRDNLDLNQIRAARYITKTSRCRMLPRSLQSSSHPPTMLQTFTLSGFSSSAKGMFLPSP